MKWTPKLAYAVGLITTDGCLSKDGRHIDFTSKDLEQIENFIKVLKLSNKIGLKSSGFSQKKYYRVQFGNIKFYKFLVDIGLTPKKSKTIGKIILPDIFFRDFLRGLLDGDGYNYFYWDPRWKSSFMLYTGFVSASLVHLEWLNNKIERLYNLRGRINYAARAYQLKFAKNASIKLLGEIYYKRDLICLKRKQFKIEAALDIIRKQAGVLKLVNRLP